MLTWIGHTHSKNENVPSLTPVERLPLPAGTIVHSSWLEVGLCVHFLFSSQDSVWCELAQVLCMLSVSEFICAFALSYQRRPHARESLASTNRFHGSMLLWAWWCFASLLFVILVGCLFFFKERERTLSWIGRKVGRLWERLR